VIDGAGGDTIDDTSTGGNELAAGGGNDIFIFGSSTASGGDTLDNFDAVGSDTIVIPFIFTDAVAFSNNILTVGSVAGAELSLTLGGTYNGTFSAVEVLSGPFRGTEVTFTGSVTPIEPRCFAAGTRIGTVLGEVPVEALREGDLIRTVIGGGHAPVVWIGHRHVDCRAHPRPEQVWPIRIVAGAFGPNAPRRDLFVSPDHALYVDGVLIPAKYLVNGVAVTQSQRNAVHPAWQAGRD
jgi:hypothetical protein